MVPLKTKKEKKYANREWLAQQIRAGLSSEEIAMANDTTVKNIEYYRAKFGLKTTGIFGLDEDRIKIGNLLTEYPRVLDSLDSDMKSKVLMIFGDGNKDSLVSLEETRRTLGMKAHTVGCTVKKSLYKIKMASERLGIALPDELHWFFKRMEKRYKNKELLEARLDTYGLINTVAVQIGVPVDLLRQWCAEEGVQL